MQIYPHESGHRRTLSHPRARRSCSDSCVGAFAFVLQGPAGPTRYSPSVGCLRVHPTDAARRQHRHSPSCRQASESDVAGMRPHASPVSLRRGLHCCPEAAATVKVRAPARVPLPPSCCPPVEQARNGLPLHGLSWILPCAPPAGNFSRTRGPPPPFPPAVAPFPPQRVSQSLRL